ncbi:MAG: hypothetical protein AAFY28_02850 [Actinomycetota bacterium]
MQDVANGVVLVVIVAAFIWLFVWLWRVDTARKFDPEGAREIADAALERIHGAESQGFKDLRVLIEGEWLYARERLMPLTEGPALLAWTHSLANDLAIAE